MRRPTLDSAHWWLGVLAAALLALLPLAWLQYRWINRISEAERDRMRAHLNSAVARFGQDFDGDLGRMLRALVSGPAGSPEEELEALAARVARLNEIGADSRLVKDLYVSRGGDNDLAELLRLDREKEEFLPVDWPPRFAELRSRLEKAASASPPQPSFLSLVDERIPALLIPRTGRRRGGLGRGAFGRGFGMRRFAAPLPGWTIVELDLDYMRKELFPALVKRHLEQSGQVDYQVRVVSLNDPVRMIYSTDPSLAAGFFRPPDAQLLLLQVRPGPGARFGGPPGLGGLREAGELRDGWLLLVRSRAGSLENVVAETRWRNLAVSFAILLLLAGSLFALLVFTHRAQRLARLQMEFVAGVSHELHTPLTVICSASDNLADGLVTGDQQVRRYGSVIRGEGRRLSHMVDQILGFAGIQSGRARFEFQTVDVRQVIERALAACDAQVRSSGCRVETELAPDLPPVSADRTSLEHCLRNLIDNAVTHGAGGGWVGVRAHRFNGRGKAVEIVIEDRGRGIAPDELPHVFDPFYRGRRSVEDQTRGFGLGLALVKRIVEAHSGSLSVQSTPGRGTAFSVRIPAISDDGESGTTDTADRG